MSSAPLPRMNPYVGPRAFQYGERLYGRDREVMDLFDLLIAERIVLLYSPSGAGKTSLIQAALISELEAERFQVLPVIRVSHESPPGLEPSVRVNRYLLSALLSLEETLPAEQQTPLAELATLEFDEYLNRWHVLVNEPDSAVLIFDQFEEILTTDPTDQRAKAEFFAQVGAALRDRLRWAIFALREDYVAGLDPFLRHIPTRFSTTFRLELLGEAAAREATQQPFRQAGVEFSDAATTKLVNDLRTVRVQQPDGTTTGQLGPYVEPVQLQVVCSRLWEKLTAEVTQIEETDIEAVGDVDSALAGYYADRVAAIAGQTGVSERAIRDWCDNQLITEQEIRGQVLQGPEQSQGLSNEAIWSLVDAHLVRAEKRRGATWFELAHDRLVEPVRVNNAAWREANLSLLQRQAALWESQGRQSGLLLRDQALADAEREAAARWNELIPLERDFLAACQEAQAIEERERRQARRIRWLAIGATIISVVAFGAFLMALYFFGRASAEGRRAEEELLISTSRELAAAAINNLDVDPERSILLAMQAVSVTHTAEAEDALHQAVQASRVQRTLSGHSGEVYDVAFSPDGARLATASWDGTAKVWDADSGRDPLTLSADGERVYGVAFSPDGKRLATAGQDGTAKVWDVTSGQQLVTLAGHSDIIVGIAFSPDGMRLATASWDRTAKVWDVASGQELFTLAGHNNKIWDVAFSPDGTRLVTASEDRTAKVWDAASGQELLSLAGHRDTINDVAFSPDGTRLATASWDGTARVWDTRSGQTLNTLAGHTNWVRGVAFNPDGTRLATASWDRTAKVWDVTSGRELFTLAGHRGWVRGVAFSPDGTRLATASEDRTAKLWNVALSQEFLTLAGHNDWVYDVAFSPDGTRLATAGRDGIVNVWDATSGQKLISLSGHYGAVRDVAFSPDGTRLATASEDRTAKVWDAATGQELATVSGHTVPVLSVAFSPDGTRLATASADRTAKVWLLESSSAGDSTSARELLTLKGHKNQINNVAFSPDGRRLATSSGDWTAKVWDADSGEELFALTGHGEEVYHVAFSPDGTRLATASVDETAKVWDADSGQELLTLTGHTDRIQSIAFSPDGTRLSTASWDGTAKVWDATSGQELFTLSGHDSRVLGVAFSPDGRHLATASGDGTARLFILDIEELMELARSRLTRSLTAEECKTYLRQEPCPPTP